ncbi:hypothetical protein AG1IA_02676 [Rhizoctonia solani AG-1 IA]|uniref:Uncharacterized protein n=1 Tax=Thanatephorus cucumeris (strain AG1-IA) TaxID=983506 RepID=L8X3W2_THACA|nr:hypothetical protein AG1IA_02676 [Rhizoctonia solani AG-1 IA]
MPCHAARSQLTSGLAAPLCLVYNSTSSTFTRSLSSQSIFPPILRGPSPSLRRFR